MKKLCLVLMVLVTTLIHSNKSYASHAAGGEITYEWVSDSTYRFYFNLYRDCTGIDVKDTVSLCFNNPCNPTTSFSVLLNKAPGLNGTTYYACAQSMKNTCDSLASQVKGFSKWVYTGLVTMPARCTNWRLSAWVQDRNFHNNVAIGSGFYAESMMNNTGQYQGNSSPYFTTRPILEACIGETCSYNTGTVDPEGDSTTYEIILPRYTSGGCMDMPANVQLSLGYWLPAEPFDVYGYFNLVQSTGTMSFTPTLIGNSIFTIRTNEYRKGVLIGRVDREMEVQVTPCNVQPPAPVINIAATTPMYVCVGQPVNFCWNAKSPNPTVKLKAFDNHTNEMPGATVTYQNQGTDSVAGCISWVPTMNDVGGHTLEIWIKDSTCNAGITRQYYDYINVIVGAPANAGKDTSICPGGAIQLSTSNQGQVAWSVVSGTPNSLSCTSCATPVATPLVTTKYELLVAWNNGCINTKDTITVTMKPVNKPSVSIVAAPDTNVVSGTNVIFTATPTNCNNPAYQWQRNGNDLPGAKQATFTTSGLSNLDVITVKMQCSDTCIIDTLSNKLKMHISTGVKDLDQHVFSIQPNPNNGEFIIKGFSGAEEMSIEILTVTGQVVYKQSNVPTANGEVNYKLNASNISSGYYMLRIKAGDRVFIERLAIQR